MESSFGLDSITSFHCFDSFAHASRDLDAEAEKHDYSAEDNDVEE